MWTVLAFTRSDPVTFGRERGKGNRSQKSDLDLLINTQNNGFDPDKNLKDIEVTEPRQ